MLVENVLTSMLVLATPVVTTTDGHISVIVERTESISYCKGIRDRMRYVSDGMIQSWCIHPYEVKWLLHAPFDHEAFRVAKNTNQSPTIVIVGIENGQVTEIMDNHPYVTKYESLMHCRGDLLRISEYYSQLTNEPYPIVPNESWYMTCHNTKTE